LANSNQTVEISSLHRFITRFFYLQNAIRVKKIAMMFALQ